MSQIRLQHEAKLKHKQLKFAQKKCGMRKREIEIEMQQDSEQRRRKENRFYVMDEASDVSVNLAACENIFAAYQKEQEK